MGRIGRGTRSPPQLGQSPPSRRSTHSRQNVHSNEQIIASVAAGGKSLSQHSQFGRNSSIRIPLSGGPLATQITSTRRCCLELPRCAD
jgi:hypothetical protein